MALKKQVRQPNGLILEYHMIAKIDIEPNQKITILVHSYLDDNARQYEKDYADGKIEGEPQFPYYDYRYIHLDYDPGMSISRAYEWIKNNIPEFEGAIDILDEDDNGFDISGEEFISMLEEVM